MQAPLSLILCTNLKFRVETGDEVSLEREGGRELWVGGWVGGWEGGREEGREGGREGEREGGRKEGRKEGRKGAHRWVEGRVYEMKTILA